MTLDKIRELVDELPWHDLRQAYDALVSAGERPGAAASAVAHLVDEFVDWRTVVPGGAGVVLEAMDFALIRAAVSLGLRFSRRGT